MADVAERLVGPALLTASAATVYTATAKTVVRNIHVFNNDEVTTDFTLSIGADATATRLFDDYGLGPRKAMVWTGFLVLDNTDIIQAYGSVTGKLTLTISGVTV